MVLVLYVAKTTYGSVKGHVISDLVTETSKLPTPWYMDGRPASRPRGQCCSSNHSYFFDRIESSNRATRMTAAARTQSAKTSGFRSVADD